MYLHTLGVEACWVKQRDVRIAGYLNKRMQSSDPLVYLPFQLMLHEFVTEKVVECSSPRFTFVCSKVKS